jgi:hypothetical protein
MTQTKQNFYDIYKGATKCTLMFIKYFNHINSSILII